MVFKGNTIGDIIDFNEKQMGAYKECRLDVNVLIEYIESNQKEKNKKEEKDES